MRSAVQDRYLASERTRTTSHRKLAKWFHQLPADARRAEEEPWQLNAAGDYRALRHCLREADIFLHVWNDRPTELLAYWKDRWDRETLLAEYEESFDRWIPTVSPKQKRPLISALADALWEHGYYNEFGAELQVSACRATVSRFGAKSVEAAKRYVQCAGYLRQLADPLSIRFAQKAVALLEPHGVSFELIEAYQALAAVTHSQGSGWEAGAICELAIKSLAELPEGKRKHLVKHGVMVIWFNIAYPHEALPVFSNLVEVEEQVFGREDRRTLESVDLLVGCLMQVERWAEASNLAMSHYLRCYRTFGDDHVQTGYAAGKFGKANLQLNDLYSAEWGLEKATNILKKAFPAGHQSRMAFLKPLEETYRLMGKLEEAQAVSDELVQLTLLQVGRAAAAD